MNCPACAAPLDDYQSRGESFAHPLRDHHGRPSACPLAGRYHAEATWQHYAAVIAFAASHTSHQTHQTHLSVLL